MDNTGSIQFNDEYNALFERSWTDDTSVDQVRFVVLDTETSGADARTAKLITIGAVAVVGGQIILSDALEEIIWTSYNSPSVTVHGITRDETRDGVEESEALQLLGKSWVYSIAFSPNGRWLASGLDDKTIRIWDVESGLPVRDLSADRRSVIYVAFSPDGHSLASGGDDKTINIWDLTNGKVVHTLSGHTKNIYAVVFSPSGRWIASASADKTVRLWDTASGREVHRLSGHGSSVTSVAFSPDSQWLVSGSWDKTIKIWDVEKGQVVETLAGNTNPIYSVAFDSSGHWLASGSQDGTIRLWRAGHP